jgi:hypothetical protein
MRDIDRGNLMLEWILDGRRLIAVAIILATLVGAWMFRYERFGAASQPIYGGRLLATARVLGDQYF